MCTRKYKQDHRLHIASVHLIVIIEIQGHSSAGSRAGLVARAGSFKYYGLRHTFFSVHTTAETHDQVNRLFSHLLFSFVSFFVVLN